MPELGEERGGDDAGTELGHQAVDVERREEGVDQGPAVGESHTPPQIRLGQRVLFVGKTGEGKSEAALGFWAIHGGQRLLIDVQDHYTLGPAALAEDPPPLEVDDPRAIDWQHRTIRYVPRRPGDRREMDALYAAIYRRGNMLVLADELEDIAPSQGPGAGFHVKKVLKQGRKYRITHLGATQRPAGVDRSAINQAEHAFIFRMVDPDDIDTLSRRVGLRARDLGDALGAMAQYEHLRHTIGDRQALHMPPLPATVLDHTHGHVLNPEHSRR
jgi:hypothetical protein